MSKQYHIQGLAKFSLFIIILEVNFLIYILIIIGLNTKYFIMCNFYN